VVTAHPPSAEKAAPLKGSSASGDVKNFNSYRHPEDRFTDYEPTLNLPHLPEISSATALKQLSALPNQLF
jgi:hypothetical protein